MSAVARVFSYYGHKLPSFMKERKFYIIIKKAGPNGNAVNASFIDCETDLLVYTIEISNSMMYDLARQLLEGTLHKLGFVNDGETFEQQLEDIQQGDFKFIEELEFDRAAFRRYREGDDEDDIGRPFAPRRQPQLRAPRIRDFAPPPHAAGFEIRGLADVFLNGAPAGARVAAPEAEPRLGDGERGAQGRPIANGQGLPEELAGRDARNAIGVEREPDDPGE